RRTRPPPRARAQRRGGGLCALRVGAPARPPPVRGTSSRSATLAAVQAPGGPARLSSRPVRRRRALGVGAARREGAAPRVTVKASPRHFAAPVRRCALALTPVLDRYPE